MLQLVESVAAASASALLFPAPSMFDLDVSDGPNFYVGDSTLRVTFHPERATFRFRHHSFSGHDDSKVCLELEAAETFWLFIRVKFGILYQVPAV